MCVTDVGFRVVVFTDALGMSVVAFISLVSGAWFTSIMTKVMLGSLRSLGPRLFPWDPFQAFYLGVQGFGWLLVVVLVSIGIWFFAGRSLSNNMPILTRVHAHIVMNTKANTPLSRELLDAADRALEERSYSKAILCAGASLEYQVRLIFNLDSSVSFSAAISRLSRISSLGVVPQELNDLVILRNKVARTVSDVTPNQEQTMDFVRKSRIAARRLVELGTSEAYL